MLNLQSFKNTPNTEKLKCRKNERVRMTNRDIKGGKVRSKV